ncbi:hypothetical protein D3790_00960 [Xenorhabdus nematophila]|nr:hypothetical protein D3790_00960 [Xenorhabdus nematophila]KHD28413.1 hypothetical protein LH67_11000 [Xenorhabdus nematophila]
MMVWGHGFFAKTMIPDHHAVQISFIKRQQPLIISGELIIVMLKIMKFHLQSCQEKLVAGEIII